MLNLEKRHPGIFGGVMQNFDKARSYKETDIKGKPKEISWEEAFTRFYLNSKYDGVTKENEDIAELFSRKGLTQHTFESAVKLRQQAQDNDVPEHILGKHLKEETILESIERIKKQTEQELENGRKMIEELYEKQFTYEWLSKYDAHNPIMGLFCSCCASITSNLYGKNIAIASIIASDVQNLVVRNSKGDIIAKGTMYINKENGYAVINDFELNEKFREHENALGRYDVEETSSQEQDREMIFKAFKRGLSAFIEEYDRQNPNNHLKQINIGMGYNRLKKQVERFKKATCNLTVPAEYDFQDAMKYNQFILYQREEKIEGKGECDR